MTLSRRTFLGTSAAAVVAAGAVVKGRVEGANERIGLCVMGVNGRGSRHVKAWIDSPDAHLIAICDVDARILKTTADGYEKKYNVKIKRYTDIRDALNDPQIDAVSIATPNHWHALGAVWAVQAGKDVYVEKPASHAIWEGQQLAALSDMTDRIIQHGTQRRHDPTLMRDIALIQSGEIIGPIHTARCLGYKTGGDRGALPFTKDSAPPPALSWRLWQGPAAEQPFNGLYHPYSWHWFWQYGNGEIGNQGAHQIDVGIWGMNKGVPAKVYSAGGRYTYEDQGQTPNTNVATYTYTDGTMLVFEARNRYTNTEGGTEINGKFFDGVGVGNLFYGSDGYYVENQGFFDKKNRFIEINDKKYPKPESDGHFQNFLNAVKARDKSLVHGTMHDAHTGCTLIHMANASYRLGRSLEFDPAAERFKDDDANAFLKREYDSEFEVPQIA